MKDMVNHPEHYQKNGKECIDILKDFLGENEFDGFLKGNILKYLFRAHAKNGLEDLKKAQWYLNYLVSHDTNVRTNPLKALDEVLDYYYQMEDVDKDFLCDFNLCCYDLNHGIDYETKLDRVRHLCATSGLTVEPLLDGSYLIRAPKKEIKND